MNHHRLYNVSHPETAASCGICICGDKENELCAFLFVLDENRVMYVPFNTTSAVRQPAYRPTMISKSDGSRRNFGDDDLQILVTVFQTSAQKAGR